jgi:broad specificity phosphatase PhoE
VPVVLLVRHGQASFGAENYDVLSALGRAQSQATGRHLAGRGLRRPVVAHGSLRRQRDSASLALAAAGLDATTRVDPRWDEYDHMDLLQRYVQPPAGEPPTSSRDVQRLLDAALLAWVQDGDAGGWPAFSGGALAALDELLAGLEKGRDAVVFTSGGIVAAVCAGLLGGGGPTVVALNRVTVNGAVTTLLAGASGTSLLTFNEHAHLDPAGVTYR